MRSSRPRRARLHVGSTSRELWTGPQTPSGSLAAAVRATLLGVSALTLMPTLAAPVRAADTANSAPTETAPGRDVSAETRYDIPAGPLSRVVSRFAAEAGIQLSLCLKPLLAGRWRAAVDSACWVTPTSWTRRST